MSGSYRVDRELVMGAIEDRHREGRARRGESAAKKKESLFLTAKTNDGGYCRPITSAARRRVVSLRDLAEFAFVSPSHRWLRQQIDRDFCRQTFKPEIFCVTNRSLW